MWTIPTLSKPRGRLDTAPFPDELVKICLEAGCPKNGIVLDPFVGSGTTVRIANEMEMSAVGIDLNREFCIYSANSLGGDKLCF